MKYDYRLVEAKKDQDFVNLCSRMGADGWRAVGYTMISSLVGNLYSALFMKESENVQTDVISEDGRQQFELPLAGKP